jgi:hypothetical protein
LVLKIQNSNREIFDSTFGRYFAISRAFFALGEDPQKKHTRPDSPESQRHAPFFGILTPRNFRKSGESHESYGVSKSRKKEEEVEEEESKEEEAESTEDAGSTSEGIN